MRRNKVEQPVRPGACQHNDECASSGETREAKRLHQMNRRRVDEVVPERSSTRRPPWLDRADSAPPPRRPARWRDRGCPPPSRWLRRPSAPMTRRSRPGRAGLPSGRHAAQDSCRGTGDRRDGRLRILCERELQLLRRGRLGQLPAVTRPGRAPRGGSSRGKPIVALRLGTPQRWRHRVEGIDRAGSNLREQPFPDALVRALPATWPHKCHEGLAWSDAPLAHGCRRAQTNSAGPNRCRPRPGRDL